MKCLWMAVAAFSFLSVPALAQDKLTEDNIKAFLKESTDLTHPNSPLSEADVTAYLGKHLNDDGAYVSSVLYEIPGQPATPKNFTLNKQQFIDNVLMGRKQMKNYDSDVKLYAHDITDDGQSASIETISNEHGDMPINPEETMPFEGTTVCKQNLSMTDGIIKLDRADCEARIGFVD